MMMMAEGGIHCGIWLRIAKMATYSVSPVVNKLYGLIQSGPTAFEITILPSASTTDDDQADKLSIEASLVLMEGKYLGLDARSLPWITRTIRKDYKTLKKEGLPESEDLLKKLLMTTQCLMLVNPDHSTAWADRRRCLLALSGDWNLELKFINLLMTQHSKAPSSWGHRKYVLQQILGSKPTSESDDSFQQMIKLMHEEIEVCGKVAEKYPKNYYAWTHRRYLWSSCLLPRSQPKHTDKLEKLLKEEFATLHSWLQHHISDHSAVHYQCQVVGLWMQHSSGDDELLAIAKTSLEHVQQLIQNHPDHESLWILRRLVLCALLAYSRNTGCCDVIRSMLQADVDAVYQNVESSSMSSANNSVHAWSFLGWCMVQLDLGGPDRSERLGNVVSFLQSHPDIGHQMWNSNAQQIMMTKG